MNLQHPTLFGRQVTLSRSLPGPIERVWGYLTEADLIERWLAIGQIGPSGSRIHLLQSTTAAPWNRKGHLCGIVMENEPPLRLSYTLKFVEDGLFEDEVEDSIVEFLLEEEQDGVNLKLTHSRLGREEISRVYAEWDSYLNNLRCELEHQDREHVRQIANGTLANCFTC